MNVEDACVALNEKKNPHLEFNNKVYNVHAI